jgi:hypothetical protein
MPTSNTAVTCPLSSPWRTRAVAAPAERQRQAVEQDGFAGAGLTGQHRQAGSKARSSRSIRTISRIESWISIGLRNRAPEFLAGAEIHEPLIFTRLGAVALQELVGIRIPLAVRIVVAENGSSSLRLFDDAHRVIGFDQTRERFFDLVGAWILLDDDAEARDGGKVFLALHIVAADLHFLAGELVARKADLRLRVIDIFGIGIVVDDRLHRLDGSCRGALILRHVDDLLGIGRPIRYCT